MLNKNLTQKRAQSASYASQKLKYITHTTNSKQIQFRNLKPDVMKTNIFDENRQLRNDIQDQIEANKLLNSKIECLYSENNQLMSKFDREQTAFQDQLANKNSQITVLQQKLTDSEAKREQIQYDILQRQINQNRYNKYLVQRNSTVTVQVLSTIITQFTRDFIQQFKDFQIFEQIKDLEDQVSLLEEKIQYQLSKYHNSEDFCEEEEEEEQQIEEENDEASTIN